MRIQSIDAFPVRLPRDLDGALGSAGSPARLEGEGEYRWAATYPCMYSTRIETALVRVRLETRGRRLGRSAGAGRAGSGVHHCRAYPAACDRRRGVRRNALRHRRAVGPHVFGDAGTRADRRIHARRDRGRGSRALGSGGQDRGRIGGRTLGRRAPRSPPISAAFRASGGTRRARGSSAASAG